MVGQTQEGAADRNAGAGTGEEAGTDVARPTGVGATGATGVPIGSGSGVETGRADGGVGADRATVRDGLAVSGTVALPDVRSGMWSRSPGQIRSGLVSVRPSESRAVPL